MGNVLNGNMEVVNLQVSKMKDVPAGDFGTGFPFVVKNITEENITLEVRPVSQKEFITTVFYPGWNPEIIAEIKEAPADSLQIGY